MVKRVLYQPWLVVVFSLVMKGGPVNAIIVIILNRNIALLIIKGIIKARDINTQRGKDLWDGLTQTIVESTKHRHGQDWHKRMMDVVDKFFEFQGYEIITEPELNWGRADLGIYMKGKKNLFVEVGTTSIQKLWFNLAQCQKPFF